MDEGTIRVSIDRHASPEEVRGVQAAFEEVGISTDVETTMAAKAIVAPWVIWIAVFAAGPFFQGYFGKFGEDAAEKTRAWVRKLREARRSSAAPEGSIVILDEKGNHVVLGDLPPEAYEELLLLDLDSAEKTYYVWSKEKGCWEDGMSRGRE